MLDSSLGNSSRIKKTALELLNVIDKLAQPHIQNQVIGKFWNWFFISHGKKIIDNMDDQDLKEIMKSGYEALRPIYEKTDTAAQLKEAEKYNDPEIVKKINELPEFAEIMDLIK